MPKDRKQQLQAEATRRRQHLEDIKRELAGATARYKYTRHPSDGASVADAAGRIRLAEMALDGVLEEIANLDRPRPVEIKSSIEALVRDRALIVQRRDWRHKQHRQAVEQARQRSGYRDAGHLATYVSNLFGPGQVQRRREDEQDDRLLRDIDAQLQRLGYQPGESTAPNPQDAA